MISLPGLGNDGEGDNKTAERLADGMPLDAMIGLLRSIRQDITGIDLSEAEHKQILDTIEEIEALVPRQKDSIDRVEAYPFEDRAVEWIKWLEERLQAANIGGTELHYDIERRVIDLEDTVDDVLPHGLSTNSAVSWEYAFAETEVKEYRGHDTKAEGVTYDRLAEALEDFREDHREYIDEIDGDGGEPAIDPDATSDPGEVESDSLAPEAATEGVEPTTDSQDPTDQDSPGQTSSTESEPPSPEDEVGTSGMTDRLMSLSGDSLTALTGLVGSDTDTDHEEGSKPQIDLDLANAAPETDNDSTSGLAPWKKYLLERDPNPEHVDESMIDNLVEAEYLQEDGQDSDIDTYAGPHARSMMEIHADKPHDPVWVGQATNSGQEVPVVQEKLFKHQFIVGKTGSGKSNLMGNQFRQLMEAGYGGLFADPNGDDSIRLMQILPENRLDDVIWIEPGGAREYITGINFLEVGLDEDDPHFDTALEALVNDLVKMIGAGDYWGPRMDRIVKNMIRAMNKSDHKFNLLDMYYILGDEASRKRFNQIIEEQGLDFIALYNREISEKDQDDFDAVLGRLQDWVENAIARQLVAFRESPINITEAVENNKIIIVRMGQESKDLKRMLSMAILRRVWAAIRRRTEQDSRNRKPFFIYMDEFDNIVREDDQTIPDMLSEARKYRLSITAATQHPSQIPDDTREDMFGNTDTRIAFKLGHIQHAKAVAPALGLDDPHTLVRESDYNFWTMLTSDRGETSEAFKSYSLPPYPPLRTKQDAENLIQQSLREHGVAMTDQDIKDALKFKFGAGELERRGVAGDAESTESVHGQAASRLRDRLLEAVYVTQIKQDAKGEFVNMDDVEDEWERRAGDLGYKSKPAQVLEKLPEELVPTENRSDGLYLRLTADALDKAGLTQDTGQNASAGGNMHRWVLSQAFEAFTVWDCFVNLPDQGEEGELPDGVVDLPIDPLERVREKNNAQAFQQAIGELSQQYPTLHDLTGGRNIAVEAETTTIANPDQTLTNLRKAVNKGKLCVFAVKPPTNNGRAPDEAPFDYWVTRGEQIIYKTKRSGTNIEEIDYSRITCARQTTENGHRQFYNGDPLVLEDDSIPLRDKSGNDLEWWERDGELVAEEETGETVTRFTDIHAFDDLDKSDFPAYAIREDGGIKVYDGGDTYEYEDTDTMEKDWAYMHEPFIPELEFDDTFPSQDDFKFVVFPLADSEHDEPMIVEGDDQRPLLPEDRSMPTKSVGRDGGSGPERGSDNDSDQPDGGVADVDADDALDNTTDSQDTTDQQTVDPASPSPEDASDPDSGATVPSKDTEAETSQSSEPTQESRAIHPIDDLDAGDVATVCGVVQSYQDIDTVQQDDREIPVRTATIEDTTGEITTRLWGRHAECSIDEEMELFITGASVAREIQDGIMQRVVHATADDTVAPAPESISPGLPTDTEADDPVPVTDGAVTTNDGNGRDGSDSPADAENETENSTNIQCEECSNTKFATNELDLLSCTECDYTPKASVREKIGDSQIVEGDADTSKEAEVSVDNESDSDPDTEQDESGVEDSLWT